MAATRNDIIARLKEDNPNAMDYVIELLTDVYMKDPDWIKNEARRLQREAKAVSKKPVEAPEKQTTYANVVIEAAPETCADVTVEA
jgi:protein required for attachment to host cells